MRGGVGTRDRFLQSPPLTASSVKPLNAMSRQGRIRKLRLSAAQRAKFSHRRDFSRTWSREGRISSSSERHAAPIQRSVGSGAQTSAAFTRETQPACRGLESRTMGSQQPMKYGSEVCRSSSMADGNIVITAASAALLAS